MRISDWSSDVCSSDLWLSRRLGAGLEVDDVVQEAYAVLVELPDVAHIREPRAYLFTTARSVVLQHVRRSRIVAIEAVAEIDRLDIEHDERSPDRHAMAGQERSEEHTSELQPLMRNSYAVFCLQKKK